MIRLSGNPDVALKKLANDMLFALVNREFHIILGKISYEHGKWDRERIQSELLAATGGKWVSEFIALNKTAKPLLTGTSECYEYWHRLPIDGKWSEYALVLRLHRKFDPQYAIELVGFVYQA